MPQQALAILCGSLLAFYGNELPDRFWSALAPIGLLFAVHCPRYRFVLLSLAAYLWASGALHYHLQYRLIAEYDNRITRVVGVVLDIPEIDSRRVRFYLKPTQIESYPAALPRLLRLSWYRQREIPSAGETWQFEIKLRQPRGLLNPAGFDYEAWQFVKGIDGGGYVRHSPVNRRIAAAPCCGIDRWRAGLASAIDDHCRSCSQQGLIKALVLGYRGDITHRQQTLLKATGTAHLLAISGLHIGLVAALFLLLGKWVWRLGLYRSGFNRLRLAASLAMLSAFAYAALAGFSLPTVRALIMLAILFVALQYRYRVNLLQSVSLAACVILCADPRAVGSASFYLSIAALLVIAFARFRLSPGSGWWRQLLTLQAYFSILFAPLGILIFGQLVPASFAANLVAIPLVSFAVLPLALIATLAAAIGFGWTHWLFALNDRLLALLLDYLDALNTAGLESIPAAALPIWLAPPLWLALAVLLLPLQRTARLAALLVLLLVALWQPPRLQRGEYELVVLDVGMGTSILLRTRHHSLVYDFGPGKPKAYSAADWALIPALRSYAIGAPDLLIASHVDQDHSGGLPAYGAAYPLPWLLSGTADELATRYPQAKQVRDCHAYPPWRWDGINFRFLSVATPVPDSSTNNRSCVLLVSGHHRTLLPGDIEISQEARLVEGYSRQLAAEVLIAPHHGSGTSSSQQFIDNVRPEYVIYTVSRGNRWGFPQAAVLRRYQARGSRQLRSDRDGAIRILSAAGELSVRALRRPQRRIWRRW